MKTRNQVTWLRIIINDNYHKRKFKKRRERRVFLTFEALMSGQSTVYVVKAVVISVY